MSTSGSDAARQLHVFPVLGIGEVEAGDDVAGLIHAALDRPVMRGDIFVITSKIVSKAEGRVFAGADREQAIDAEAMRTIASRQNPGGSVTRIVQNRFGLVSAAAGVDTSNSPGGRLLLLPEDPDRSARDIAATLRTIYRVDVGVVISDTLGRPWREGQTDCAIGAGGVRVLEDLRGDLDTEGTEMAVTVPCVGDEIAAAGDLVKRKTTRVPIAVLRGRGDLVGPLDLPGASSIVRPPDRDMFSLGAREAYEEGFAAGLAAADPAADPPPSDPRRSS
ncbi:coenzyme F420-0:L-glutamate ligase [Leucobacter weissii]|uniref:Coenzyme F420-0:L-glutamate ligase n=2 Tax=Leucobacter weissii TaxID=1983706 RepID=A0A939MMA8_9MICO|nr:coenzyme F420-0:L-glutamate ligase [Leucobacter weissii]